MTTQRVKVLSVLMEDGAGVTWAHIARRCGLHDYRAAKRIVRDLRRMGRITE